MYEIIFAGPSSGAPGPVPARQDTGECPVCGERSARAVLTVKATAHLPDDLDLVECRSCGTMYFLGDDPVLGYDFAGFERTYWYNYVQNGAGISAMLEPLLAIGGRRGGDLLDVGCGFGYVPDFWQKTGLGNGIGLETSLYGEIGREKLGVEIVHSYYADAAEIAGRKFDYVFSSEVIEHVRDPRAFIKEISAALKPDGILILTTPCADAIRPETDVPNISAVLSPGFHYFVTRRSAMEAMLRASGFTDVLVRNTGNRLLCWASNAPLPDIAEEFSDWELYLGYLDMLSNNPDRHVAGGALYRALKDSINLGQFDRAERIYPFFEALAKSAYDIDFRSPGISAERARSRLKPDNATFPSWLGCGYLFAGRYLELEKADPAVLEALFGAAVGTMTHEIDLGMQFAQEPFYFLPMAREHLEQARAAGAAQTDVKTAETYPLAVVRTRAGTPVGNLDVAGMEVCLFVAFAPAGRLLPGARHLLKGLVAAGLHVVVCLAVDDTEAAVDLDGMEDVLAVVARKNGGYDFSAWAAALAEMPGVWAAKRLFFVNDSILGPLRGFADMMHRIRASSADFIALTESCHHVHHSQSYFFVIQNKGLRSPEVRNFWRHVQVHKTKEEVIKNYELMFLSHVRDTAGLSAEILFSCDALFPGADHESIKLMNPTHQLWEHLLHQGYPFVKAELLYSNPMGMSIAHWEPVVALHGGDVGLIRDHLEEMRETRGRPLFQRADYKKWQTLRWIIGDDRFFDIRERRAQARRLRRQNAESSSKRG